MIIGSYHTQMDTSKANEKLAKVETSKNSITNGVARKFLAYGPASELR